MKHEHEYHPVYLDAEGKPTTFSTTTAWLCSCGDLQVD